MILDAVKRGLGVLGNPEKGIKSLKNRTFEEVLGDYMVLLIASALLAGTAAFLYSLVNAIYLELFTSVDINYLRFVNYSLGTSVSLTFFYLFAGTAIMFFISLILVPFFRGLKYIHLLEILFYSAIPLLLFGWVPIFAPALLIWAVFLFVTAIRLRGKIFRTKIDVQSIHQRD